MSLEDISVERTRKIIVDLLEHMEWGEEYKDENFRDTPDRVAQWLHSAYTTRPAAIAGAKIHTLKTFPTNNDQLLVQGPIRTNGMCPHHLLPIAYEIYIGVLLNRQALGLSKYARVCEALAQYPWIQEDYTTKIAEILDKALNTNGIMVMVDGEHSCMKIRGVKQPCAWTTTSKITGRFKEPSESVDPKTEFLSIVQNLKLAHNHR